MFAHTTTQPCRHSIRSGRSIPAGGMLAIASIVLGGCLADSMDPPGGSLTGPSYTVAGTVEGLVGDLTLALNGGETVTVSNGDAFAFDSGLGDGESYAVTVVQHPAGQHCDVENGEGTAVSDVTDVMVQCETQAAQGSASPSSTRVTVDWEDTGADSYNLYWSSDPDFEPESYGSYADSGMASSVTPPFQVDDLSPGRNYYFRIETSLGGEEVLGGLFDTRTFVPGMDFTARFIEQTDDYVFVSGARATGVDNGRFGYMAAGFEVIDRNSGNRRAHPALADNLSGLANRLPNIRSIVSIDDETLIVAGQVYSSDGESEHDGLVMIDASGRVVADWKPQLPGSRPNIHDMAYHEDTGILYVVGRFNETNTPEEVSENIAAIDLETGETLDWSIAIGGSSDRVRALSVAGDTLYVAGEFGEVTDKESSETFVRFGLAAFDLADERSLMDWAPNPDEEVWNITAIGSGSDRRIIVPDDEGALRVYDDAGAEDTNLFSEINEMPDAWGEMVRLHDGTLYISGWYEDGAGGEYSLLSADLDGSIIHKWEYDEIGWVYSFGEVDGDLILAHEDPENDAVAHIGFVQPDEIVSGWELKVDSVPAAISGWGDRLAVGGGFAIHGIVDRNLLAVLNNDLEWDTDWPDVLGAFRTNDMLLDEEAGRLYLAGAFQEMTDGEQVYAVPFMTAIDINSRTVLEDWPAEGPDRAPSRMVLLDDMLAVGGNFDEWGGDTQFSKFILIDSEGEAVASLPEMRNEGAAWSGPSAILHDSHNDYLYFAGRFDEGEEPGGFEPRSYFARIDVSNINAPVLDSWGGNLSTDGHNNRTVESLVFRSGSQYLYASMGGLEEIDDGSGVREREGFVALSGDGSSAQVLNWDPDASGGGGLPRHALWAGHGHELILGRRAGIPGGGFGDVPVAARTDGTGANLGLIGPGVRRPVSLSLSIRESDGRMCFGMEDGDPRQMENDNYRMGIICFDDEYEQAW